jgi:hypothetical protein
VSEPCSIGAMLEQAVIEMKASDRNGPDALLRAVQSCAYSLIAIGNIALVEAERHDGYPVPFVRTRHVSRFVESEPEPSR